MMKVRIVKLPKCRHRPMMIEIHATVTGKVGIEASYYTESNGGSGVLQRATTAPDRASTTVKF